jgi:hypothetical protein
MTPPHKETREKALEALNKWHEEFHPEEALFCKTNMPPINLYNIGPSKLYTDFKYDPNWKAPEFKFNKEHMKTTRSSVLTEANRIVNGARADQYGGPENSFSKIASLWTAYLSSMDEEVNISPSDVACMMTLLKIARLYNSPDHQDSWVDVAGYAACGAEVAKPSYRDMFSTQYTNEENQRLNDEYAKEQMQSAQSDDQWCETYDGTEDSCSMDEYTPPWDHRALTQAVSKFYDLAKESK